MPARNMVLTFATISLPSKVMKATDTPPEGANLCAGQPDHPAHSPLPVKKPTICTECGPIPEHGATLIKAIKQGTGSYAILDQEALEEANATYRESYKAVLELVPHPAEEFLASTGPGGMLNYVTPAGATGANQYRVLVKLIEAHPELAFVGLHTPSSKTALWHVRVHKGVLVMEERVRAENLRAVPDVIEGEVHETMLRMLDTFLPELVTPYEAEAYEDSYGKVVSEMQALAEVVTTAGEVTTTTTGTDNQVIDLLEAQMERITSAAKAKTKTPAKKTAAKRAPAQKKEKVSA